MPWLRLRSVCQSLQQWWPTAEPVNPGWLRPAPRTTARPPISKFHLIHPCLAWIFIVKEIVESSDTRLELAHHVLSRSAPITLPHILFTPTQIACCQVNWQLKLMFRTQLRLCDSKQQFCVFVLVSVSHFHWLPARNNDLIRRIDRDWSKRIESSAKRCKLAHRTRFQYSSTIKHWFVFRLCSSMFARFILMMLQFEVLHDWYERWNLLEAIRVSVQAWIAV